GYTGGTMAAPAVAPPYWITVANMPTYGTSPGSSTPPNITFANGTPIWAHIRNGNPDMGVEYWLLMGIQLSAEFDDPGTPAVLPEMGRNAYAFLNDLSPAALTQLQTAFGVPQSAGSNAGVFGAILDPATGQPLVGANINAGGNANTGLDTLYG